MENLSHPRFNWLQVLLTLIGSFIIIGLIILGLIPFTGSDSTILGRGPISPQITAQIRWILFGVGSVATFAMILTLIRNFAPKPYRTVIAIGYFGIAVLVLLLVLILG